MRLERPGAALVEARLAHTLTAAGRAVGLDISVTEHRSRSWASATFAGAQHAITLAAPRSPALGGWVATLPDAELPLTGHLVASIAVDRIEDDGADVTLTITALTIEAS
ncbi:hypothetical protein [Sphingomonas bacterium]|uniref:hypothetical protein n=1 Tax=Sphingomonas bacterium TaxID=1895847 RepID=UPI001577741C|nr:hypothetical protein [Sphingomonas bacterium]